MNLSTLITPNIIMVELILEPSGANTLPVKTRFPEQPQLINRPIISIQALCATDLAFGPTTGLAVIPDAAFPQGWLNVQRAGNAYSKAGTWFKYVPLTLLRNVMATAASGVSGSLDKFRIDPCFFQWNDTNLNFPPGIASAQALCVPFLFEYLLEDQDPMPFYSGYKSK
jgi:hypothetical protein